MPPSAPHRLRFRLKQFLKQSIRGVAIILVSPLLLTHFVLSRFGDRDASLETHAQWLCLIPGALGSYLRVAFYRFTLKHCHPTATIGFGALCSKTDASIGRHVYVGPRCMLGSVKLEEDVLLGPSVQIPSGPMTHGYETLDTPIRLQPGQRQTVSVGRDCWIGAGSIVVANVSEQTVVGAGSVVTKTFPPRLVLAGVPAKRLKHRDGRDLAGTEQHALRSNLD